MPFTLDLPDQTTFAAALADLRLVAAASVALLAGLVRGFSGFGGALIYMPLVAAIYDPRLAAATMLLVDFFSSAPYTVPEARRCVWREVVPIWVATAIAIPFGTFALIVLDPAVLRWGIAILVLGLLAVLVSGWRYQGKTNVAVTTGVGLFAGFGAGAVQIAGPPVIIYWLSRGGGAVTMRANLMVYFALCGVILVLAYLSQGLITATVIAHAILLGLPYLVGIGVGARFFRGASDLMYRRIAYGIIAAAALLSLPVLDRAIR